mgnify:FL=1|jgi:hypothetical protein
MSNNKTTVKTLQTTTVGKVVWLPLHVKELDRVFPEDVSNEKYGVMCFRNGQRSVIKYIEQQVQKMLKENPNGIS